jgi:hypothetical protein
MPQTPSATSSPPPRPTLSYSTHRPGEPIVSDRTDGLEGVEIDIPPLVQRWPLLPPRSVGGAIGLALAALGAVAPVAFPLWMWIRSGDRTACLIFFLSLFVETFLFCGLGWAAHEIRHRRTTISAGPDGLTMTTVGGTAWPKPRFWPRSEIIDLRYVNRIGSTQFEGEYVVLVPVRGRQPVVVDGLQLLVPKVARPLLAQLRQALALDPRPSSSSSITAPSTLKPEDPIP